MFSFGTVGRGEARGTEKHGFIWQVAVQMEAVYSLIILYQHLAGLKFMIFTFTKSAALLTAYKEKKLLYAFSAISLYNYG